MTITLEQAAKWHEARAAEAHQGLSCGSENSEYRMADKVAEMHRMAAGALRNVATAHAEGMEEAARIIQKALSEGSEIPPKAVPYITGIMAAIRQAKENAR